MSSGKLYIVSAPSGAGKTSLLSALVGELEELQISISHTTRSMRPGEVEGSDYHFVSLSEFDNMMKNNQFLEHAEVFGNYYGTSKQWVSDMLATGVDVILEIDWQGAQQVKQHFPAAISVFILPPSIEALHTRLVARAQDDEKTIAKRVSQAQNEIVHYTEYDYIIINDAFAKALTELKAVFLANRVAINSAQERHRELLNQLLC